MKPLIIILMVLPFCPLMAIVNDTLYVSQDVYDQAIRKMAHLEDQMIKLEKEYAVDQYDMKDYVRDKYENWLTFWSWFTFLFVSLITTVATGAGTYAWFKKRYESLLDKGVESTVSNIDKRFEQKMITFFDEKMGEKEEAVIDLLRRNTSAIQFKTTANILVLNQLGTPTSVGFKQILSIFQNHKLTDIESLSSGVTYLKKYRKQYDFLIIENADIEGLWNLKRTYSKGPEDEKAKIEKKNRDVETNIEYLIQIALEVCPRAFLMYYGKAGDGRFPVEDPRLAKYQEKISFANTPSQLFGNLLNQYEYKLLTQPQTEN